MGAIGNTGPVGPTGPGTFETRSFPACPVSVTFEDLTLDFMVVASYVRNPNSVSVQTDTHIVARVGDSSFQVSQVSFLSPNSFASAVPWVATSVESKLNSMGVRVPMIDLDVLEGAYAEASELAHRFAMIAFFSAIVGRLDERLISEAFKDAQVGHVLET